MLTAAYVMLRDGVEYHDLGNRCFTERDKAETTNGFSVGYRISVSSLK